MAKLRRGIITALLIIASCLLPGADIDCDCEDGEFDINFDEFCCDDHDDCDDHDGCGGWIFDFWWDD